ncbi:MAG: aldo/keto reductase [Chitinophagia bacterium]|jgi:predicted oxidoreductase|nr:aldo/keto reductase [Chitinophagia bacterium]
MKKQNPIIGCMRWGVWGAQFTTQQYEKLIQQCIEHGLNTFDHADIYGHYTTEADFGKALQNNSSLRNQIELITKTGIQMLTPNRPKHNIKSYNTSASHMMLSVENSLKNFHTDYIDTLLIHRPDILLDIHEIAEVIAVLKKQGKVKNFGVSNFTTSQVELLSSATSIQVHQVEISVTQLEAFENGVLDQCQIKNIQAQAWSPWGNGLFENVNPKHVRILEAANQLAAQYATGVNEILLAFLYAHPSKITPVIGTTKMERILQAKDAMQIDLSREDFYILWSASNGKEVA